MRAIFLRQVHLFQILAAGLFKKSLAFIFMKPQSVSGQNKTKKPTTPPKIYKNNETRDGGIFYSMNHEQIVQIRKKIRDYRVLIQINQCFPEI